jgi:hypothetical protein
MHVSQAQMYDVFHNVYGIRFGNLSLDTGELSIDCQILDARSLERSVAITAKVE